MVLWICLGYCIISKNQRFPIFDPVPEPFVQHVLTTMWKPLPALIYSFKDPKT